MQRALSLAELGRLTASPNPMVGCVIVNEGEIVGEGFHQRAGEPHAEINALHAAGEKARGAEMYVTLEPCCHHGHTPPCTKTLIAAGIKKINIATLDPNPQVAGQGVNELTAAGINVTVGMEESAAKNLNQIYFHFRKEQRPFVIAKWAMSLDGKTITNSTDRNISSSAAREEVHRTRSMVDAILIGANTARLDNPLLTTRLSDTPHKHPTRIILTRDGNLPFNLRCFDKTLPAKTLVVTTEMSDVAWRDEMKAHGIEVLLGCHSRAGGNDNPGFLDLNLLLKHLGHLGITSLLVEGGMTTHQQFFAQNIVDKAEVYITPIFIGNSPQKIVFNNPQWQAISDDMYCSVQCSENVRKGSALPDSEPRP